MWEELKTQLGRSFLFAGLSAGQLDALAGDAGCRLSRFSRGETVYEAHRFERSLGFLAEGSLRVSKGELIVSTLTGGEFFGAAALFNDRPDYATTLTALSDCEIVFFRQALVERVLETNPAAARAYIRYLSGRIRFLDDKLEQLLAGSAEEKLWQYLLGGAKMGTVRVEHSFSVLARRLGISRASLYRAFDALERAGVIRRTGKTIALLPEAAASSDRKDETI